MRSAQPSIRETTIIIDKGHRRIEGNGTIEILKRLYVAMEQAISLAAVVIGKGSIGIDIYGFFIDFNSFVGLTIIGIGGTESIESNNVIRFVGKSMLKISESLLPLLAGGIGLTT